MRNSLIDTNKIVKRGNYLINSSLYGLNRLEFLNLIQPNMIYEYEVLEDISLPLLSLKVYGDSNYWDIILFLNGTEFNILPNSNNFIYSEADRLKQKLSEIYKHTKSNIELSAYNLLNDKNSKKRKIKLLRKEYLGAITSQYLERKR